MHSIPFRSLRRSKVRSARGALDRYDGSGCLENRLTLAGWFRWPVDMEEVDAVITTIGGTTKSPEADSQGNINLIEAALKKGVRKFIMVSSIGAGDSKNATPPEVLR